MLIDDIEKLIKQLREEHGMTQEEARKEAFKRALEDMDNDGEGERDFDRPLGGLPAPHFDKARQEAFNRKHKDMDDDFEGERGFDRPLGGLPAPHFDETRQEAFNRKHKDMDDDFEGERGFDRPLGGYPAPHFDESEGDVAGKDNGKPSEGKGFFRRIIDKFCKGG